jgi:hypothetical protein
MQIESLEASAFYKVCTSKYRTSILQKYCSSTRNDESDEKDGRWIMCVPQSRSLGRRITRDDVGTLKRRFFFHFVLIYLSLNNWSLCVYWFEEYSLSISIFLSLIYISLKKNH